MAFNFTYFQRVTSTISPFKGQNPTEGQATGQGPTIWTYNASSTGSNESTATVTAANYFLGASGFLAVGDWIICETNDPGHLLLNVTVVTAGTTVTVAEFTTAGSLSLPNGTAAAPSLFFTSDPTTGLYRIGASDIGVALGGVEAASFSTTSFNYVLGNLVAGKSGTAGTVSSFPSTTAKGSLVLAAVNNTGDTVTTISNAAMGQASVVSIPDPGAATANFLLDAGTANTLTDFQVFVGLDSVLSFGTGTWTTTRGAEGNYFKAHSAAAETSIIGIDVTPYIRTTASKGFKLVSFDVIYQITTAAALAHTVTLDKINYANNAAVTVTSVPVTGTLATATQANPYVTAISVTTPAFDNTTDSKYVIEVTVQNDTTTVYDFYGIVLKFDQTIA